MPPKIIKSDTGRIWTVKAIRLANGNLLIPQRMEHDRRLVDWVEAAPGTSGFKRWSLVASDESDPRNSHEYQTWRAQIESTPEYQQWKADQGE